MTILVTGSAGMIGSNLVKELLFMGYDVVGVDKKKVDFDGNYEHFTIDLGQIDLIRKVFSKRRIDRVIHLAALAHTLNKEKYSKRMYEHLNVECSNNVFKVAFQFNVPVLFISTVDVFGFQKGIVDTKTECHPVTIYGKTKYEAERLLMASGCAYSIYRLSPVYSQTIRKDIQKRFYLRYPNWAYRIGKNTGFEVLDIQNAIKAMSNWCNNRPNGDIRIIKDCQLLFAGDYLSRERLEGRAKHLLVIPRWLALSVYYALRITGKNKFTFLLNKALYPLRTK